MLNDFVEDGERSSIFRKFATWLRPGGILIFDVREWTKTVERYTKGLLHQRTVKLSTGTLEFCSKTVLDMESRQLRICAFGLSLVSRESCPAFSHRIRAFSA